MTLAGATLSSGAIPRQELRANAGVPAWELPLHEWWHQVEGRAEDWLQLETSWPPHNHDPIKVGARRLDPRTWVDETNDTAIAWYEHVLGSMPQAFWADVWARGERIARDDANLALQSIPMGEGMVFADGLADTVLSFGRYLVPATEEGASEPWFGLLWLQERTVGRVVVHTGGRNGRSWSDAALAFGMLEDKEWTPIHAEVTRDGDRWTFTFPPVQLHRLRVRPVEGPGGAATAARNPSSCGRRLAQPTCSRSTPSGPTSSQASGKRPVSAYSRARFIRGITSLCSAWRSRATARWRARSASTGRPSWRRDSPRSLHAFGRSEVRPTSRASSM